MTGLAAAPARWLRAGGAAGPAQREQGPASPGLLSVVVPVYAVERYLAECLDSLLAQSYRDLEVVVVDDGSPDGSYDIALGYAREDPRVRLLRQSNAGLSAARNAGAAAATGTWLTFLDSDDRLVPRAYSRLVSSLERSGSDFAVGCYRRFDASRTWPAGSWVREAHAWTRTAVTLEQHPDALVNAVPWSKVYRRSFYVEQGLSFVPGVLYEDQEASARAYARARSFDVLSDVTHEWRVREDASSITQRVGDPDDLRARLVAAHRSIAVLREEAGPAAARVRLRQLLSNDLPVFITQVPQAGEEFWELLVDGLHALGPEAGDPLWSEVPTGSRALAHLVASRRRDELHAFLAAAGRDVRTQRTSAAGGVVVADLPLSPAVPEEERRRLAVLAPSQTRLITSLRRVRWTGPGLLQVDAWAYVDNVDLGSTPATLRVQLREQRTGAQVSLSTAPVDDPDVMAADGHAYCDYRPSVFRADVRVEDLLVRVPGDWQLHVEVEVAGVRRSGAVLGLYAGGSAGDLRAQRQASGTRVLPVHLPGQGLVLQVRRAPTAARSLSLVDRTLHLALADGTGSPPVLLRARHDPTGRVVEGQVEAGGRSARLVLPRLAGTGADEVPHHEVGRTGRRAPAHGAWTVRAVDADGHGSSIAWPALLTDDRVHGVGDAGLRAVRTRAGNVSAVEADDGVVVERVALLDDALEVRLVLAGSRAAPPDLSLQGPRLVLAPSSVQARDGALVVRFPLRVDRWGFGSAPLPTGDHVLTATRSVAGEQVTLPVDVEPVVTAGLPLRLTLPETRLRLDRRGSGTLRLRVERPLPDEERGAFAQQRLRTSHGRAEARPEDAVVFLRGPWSATADHAWAVHEELRRRGAPLTTYWSVSDLSGALPPGAVPVVRDSAEHHRVLRDARYVLDEASAPVGLLDLAHQVVLGLPAGWPPRAGGSRQAGRWHRAASPAPWATPVLRRSLAYDGDVLEVGRPGSDLLLASPSSSGASAVRQRLGVDDGVVVLHAPGPGPVHRGLDLAQLARGLGPRSVVLVLDGPPPPRRARGARLLDVNGHPRVDLLLLAADVLLARPSALCLDAALAGRPVVLLDGDAQEPLGLPVPLPGDRADTLDEVLELLRDPVGLWRRQARAAEALREAALPLDDGRAAARLVDAVFGVRGHA